MSKNFSKLVSTSDGEEVVVFMQEHRDGFGLWSCGFLTRYGDFNAQSAARRFESFEACHHYFCAMGTAEADAAIKVPKERFLENLRLHEEYAKLRQKT